MFDVNYNALSLAFTYGKYPNGGTYLDCETIEGPYADISVWVSDVTPFLSDREIVIPLYKLNKPFLDKVESYGFLKIDYERTVRINYGVGCIGILAEDFKTKIEAINKEWFKKVYV